MTAPERIMNLVYHFLHARNTQLLEPGSVLFKEHDAVARCMCSSKAPRASW
jgi:hypothetical protein